MTTFTVTTLQDFIGADGQRSLREAVNSANATPEADTIVFAPALEGQTLTLTQGELRLTQDVTIDGDADNNGSRVTLSGGGTSRIFSTVGSNTDVGLTDIVLTGGHADGSGGAVLIGGGSLTMTRADVSYSGAYVHGGGIYAGPGTSLSLISSHIYHNYLSGSGYGAGISLGQDSVLVIEDSILGGNFGSFIGDFGGAISIQGGTANIARTTIASNDAYYGGGGIMLWGGSLSIESSTIAGNSGALGYGGIEQRGGYLIVRNSIVTANSGIYIGGIGGGQTAILNSVIAGNRGFENSQDGAPHYQPIHDDMYAVAYSNGHNIFGSIVLGAAGGDRQSIAANTILAFDPSSGFPLDSRGGVIPLLATVSNPALGAADRFAAMTVDQLGQARSQPSGAVPDIGPVESAQAQSTTASANNDLLTGTSAANTISGLAGNDYIRGMAGNDRLAGGDGSDLLDGGTGNDRLDGGSGIDAALFGGSTSVVVDLSGTTDTAKRGSETDTLVSIEGAIGSSAADTFRGDAAGNRFMGGDGRDVYTGGAGRDLFDFNTVNDSRVGASVRDLITDFIVGQDKIDLAGIDANAIRAGDQAFRWVGSTAFAANRPGEVGWFTSGTNTIIHANTDADSADELQLQLSGNIGASLAATDFHL